jgi:hypothetical protein
MPPANQYEYLVLSRGQWHKGLASDELQSAIDDFYRWIEAHIAAGRMRPGQRLAPACKLVTRERTLDGPFSEAKEIIGGYWFIIADSIEKAAALAAENPCLAHGLSYEIRPLELRRASAFEPATETPE